MRLIFEDHKYDIEKIDNVLSFLLSDKDRAKGTYIPKCVGYFYNPNIDNGEGKPKGDIVFVLPKVLLSPATDDSGDKETLFNVEPEKLINLDWETWKNCDLKEGNLTKKEIFDFIYGFSIWIYRAIEVYRKNLQSKSRSQVDEVDDEDADIETNKSIRVGKSGKKTDNTFMDILLSLVDFQKQHHDYIMYVMKMAHSGFNKINWTRTVTRSTAIIQDDAPVYLNPINKRKEINFDEELLIIFYSILNYIHEKYGFQISNNPGYTLIKGKMFESYMDKQGKHRLLKIKYKYFSDTALKLWNLCYVFFDKTSNIHAQANTTDYLLVNSFHTVFEAMIDELIGDKNLPRDLKIQEGGSRRVDSLYTYKYLMENLEEKEVDMTQKIYHIGDAKYHKRTSELKDVDIPKQFDYATNVVKWHMDLLRGLLDEKVKREEKLEYQRIKLYDDITKGFNIIPNFFVSAKVEDLKKDYDDDIIELSNVGNKFAHEQTMFGEQLFDRNTLFALHYDVRFLYVLKQYAMNRNSNKVIWQEKAREQFRNSAMEYLNDNFNFYQLLVSDNDNSIKLFVSQFYYVLQGKIFSFEAEEDGNTKRVLVYAERITPDNGTDGDGIRIEGIKKDHKKKSVVGAKGNMTLCAPNAVSVNVEIQAIQLGKSSYEVNDGVLQSLEGKLFDQKVIAAIELLRTSGMDSEHLRQLLGIEIPTQDNSQYVVEEESAPSIADYEEPKLNIIDPEEDTDGKLVIPLYTIRAACGKFLYNEEAEVKGWIDTKEYSLPYGETIFVVQAQGHSMEPTINDGDYCVFAHDTSFYERDIILAEIPDMDSEYGGSFTIKKYAREKSIVDGIEQKVSITLAPINSDYDTMSFDIESEDKPKMVGVFRKVIGIEKQNVQDEM